MKKGYRLFLALCITAALPLSVYAGETKTAYQTSFEPENEETISVSYVGEKLSEEQLHDLSKKFIQYSVMSRSQTCPGSKDGKHHYAPQTKDKLSHSNDGVSGSLCYIDVYRAASCTDCPYISLQLGSTTTHTVGDGKYDDCLS